MANVKSAQGDGSALLIALILMGILMTLSLGVSHLLIGTLKDSRNLLEITQARYAAESGLEHALWDIAENAPGFEKEESRALPAGEEFFWKITAKSSEYPQNNEYALLALNESVTVPLFGSADAADSVKNFRVDFYLAPELALSGALVDEDLDLLRWKIFGKDPGGQMEVINEFIPMQNGKNTPENPSCMGTDDACWNTAKFYEQSPSGINIMEHKLVKDFLQSHTQNFLVLTNIVNPDLILADSLSLDSKKQISGLYYRVKDLDGERRLTLPKIKISADGKTGATVQSLDLEIERDSFLPVFNYALYRTAE